MGINLSEHGWDEVAETTNDIMPLPPRKFIDDGDGFGISTPDKLDETYLFLIERDLDFARLDINRQKLSRLSFKDLRGLAYETWIHFGCGFIPDWILTKSRAEWQCGTYVNKETGERKHLPPPSDRIIIPTPGMRHFNAIALASDRPRMKKDFWKQHAGEKELFYEKGGLSKAEIVIVVEGEVDTMSIWQACIGRRTDRNFAPVAILGRSNYKRTLLPNLNTLFKGKKLLLLLDADEGRESSAKLRQELIRREVPAVSKFLYDELNDADKKFFDEKVDANDILIKRGGDFLETLIEKILADATTDFEKAQQEIDSQNLFSAANMPANDVSDKPAPKKKYASNPKSDVEEIKLILKDYVHASSLGRDEWWSVGAIMFRYGFTVDDFKAWSNDGDPRYNADRCQTEWDSYASEIPHLKDDEGYKLGTLINLAKKYGYKPKGNKNPHITGDETIDHWQKNNGVVDKDFLAEMKDFAHRLDTLDKVTAGVANDLTVQRYLGAFRYYSFFNATADKFLTRLRDAKADAKAKLSAWKKDNTQPAPSDDDKALAALDLNAVKRKIETFFTDAKKAHAKYKDDLRQREADAQRKAEHAAYVKEQPTTQKEIPDCPVDLILPEGVIFNDEGIKIRDIDNQRLKDDPPIIETCQNLIVPTKIFRETATHMTKYEVAIQTGKVWRRKIFDGRTLQDTRSVSELGNYGAHITDSRMMAKFFSKIIAVNEQNGRLREITSFTMPGWQDNDFSTFIYPPDGDDYHVERNNVDYASIFATRGDANKWLEMFKDVTDFGKRTDDPSRNPQGHYVRFSIGACLAAPLLKPLGVKNIQINLWGQSNLAKTPLPKVGLSVFGDPSEGRMFRTWGGTAKNRLTMAAAFCDFPQLLDEAETMSRKAREAQSEAIYDFFSGIINQANRKNGDVRAAEIFRSVRFSTAEKPMLSINDKRGAYKRVIDVHIDRIIFPDAKARDLHLFVESNHGHFGRQWVEYISKNYQTIRNDFDKLNLHFEQQGLGTAFNPINLSEVDATNVRSIITCVVAFYHFLVCLKLTKEFDTMKAINLAEQFLSELPTVKDMSDVQRSKDLLASWVAANSRRFVSKQNDRSMCVEPVAGRKFNNGDIGFLQSEFRKIIEDDLKLPSYEKFLCDLFDAGALDCANSRDKTRQRNLGSDRLKMYVIKAGTLIEKNSTPEFEHDEEDDE